MNLREANEKSRRACMVPTASYDISLNVRQFHRRHVGSSRPLDRDHPSVLTERMSVLFRLTKLLAPVSLAIRSGNGCNADRRVATAEDVGAVTRAVHPRVHRVGCTVLTSSDVFGHRGSCVGHAIRTGHPRTMLASAAHQIWAHREGRESIASTLRIGLRDDLGFGPAERRGWSSNRCAADGVRHRGSVDRRRYWGRSRYHGLVDDLRLWGDANGVIGIGILRVGVTGTGIAARLCLGRNRTGHHQGSGQDKLVHHVHALSSLQKNDHQKLLVVKAPDQSNGRSRPRAGIAGEITV